MVTGNLVVVSHNFFDPIGICKQIASTIDSLFTDVIVKFYNVKAFGSDVNLVYIIGAHYNWFTVINGFQKSIAKAFDA